MLHVRGFAIQIEGFTSITFRGPLCRIQLDWLASREKNIDNSAPRDDIRGPRTKTPRSQSML